MNPTIARWTPAYEPETGQPGNPGLARVLVALKSIDLGEQIHRIRVGTCTYRHVVTRTESGLRVCPVCDDINDRIEGR